MFGWRKRKDGFEWHEYVRTTILLRRKKRRERLGEAGQAAVRGLKEAGERGAVAGAEGAKAFGRGAKAAGLQSAIMSAAGARAAGSNLRNFLATAWTGTRASGGYLRIALAQSWIGLQAAGRYLRAGLVLLWAGIRLVGRALRVGLGWLWAGLCVAGSRLRTVLGPAAAAMLRVFEPALSALREPSVSTPLVIVGGVAGLGAVARIVGHGFDRDALIALFVALAVLGALLVARLANGGAPWLRAGMGIGARGLGGTARGIGRLGGPTATAAAKGVAVVLALVAVAGGVWFLLQSAPMLPSPPSLGIGSVFASEQVEGRGVALSGDTLRVAKKTIRLDGIEAPEPGQTCLSSKSRRWRCADSAKSALRRLVRRKRLGCELTGSDDSDRPLGKCRAGETDIAAELVRGGHVFATQGFFAPYGALEAEARDAKRGIWGGKAKRPSDYRAQKWEEAKRDAPDGCPIKGNMTRGRRVYVLPWSRSYEKVTINRKRGERWFCSEADALAAGWKPYEQS